MSEKPIPAGSYTKDTLPPLSDEAERILEEIRALRKKIRTLRHIPTIPALAKKRKKS